MKVSCAMSGTRSTSRTIRPISRSIRRWYLTTSISKALTSPCLTRSTSGASASGAFIQRKWRRPSARPRRAARRRIYRAAQGVPLALQRHGAAPAARRSSAAGRDRGEAAGTRRGRSPPRASRSASRRHRARSVQSAVAAGQHARLRRARARPRVRSSPAESPAATARRAQRPAPGAASRTWPPPTPATPRSPRRRRSQTADAARRRSDAASRSKNTLSRMAGADASAQARLKTRVPLVPPNPKLFLTACSIFIGRAVVGAVVEIALRILVEDVDRRRRDLVVQRHAP